MKTVVTIENGNHSQSNKTLTILSAFVIGLLVAFGIFYGVYRYWSKQVTVFVPVKNTRIAKLLKESKKIEEGTPPTTKEKDNVTQILEKLKKECNTRKLLLKNGTIADEYKNATLPGPINQALTNGRDAEEKIKEFLKLQKKSKNDSEKKGKFDKLVHETIETPTGKQNTPPTDKEIKKAYNKLVENLKKAQEAWDKGKEKDDKEKETSYEELYIRHSLVSEYTKLKGILEQK